MTAQQRKQAGGIAILGGIVSALTIAMFVARAVASEKVEPVKEDVAALKAQRVDDNDRLGRMEDKLDRISERLGIRKDP